MAIKEVFVPGIGRNVKFQARNTMQFRGVAGRTFRHAASEPPATTLPVDGTGDAAVSCPMDGNDVYGICGEAMVAHCDNILTYRQGQGTESVFDLSALERQYLSVSRGDNGLNEDQVVNGIWKVGIAGNARAIIVDALDIDVTNVPLARFAIDQFYTIQMAWSVPDRFHNGFTTGSVWDGVGVPDPRNGHYTPLADVGGPETVAAGGKSLNGFYRVFTWGGWGWVSPSYVASVQPQCFIAFSPRQFDPTTGLDSKGRHVATQAKLWELCGGHPIPQAVIAAFPPPGVTPPGPNPLPPPIPRPDDVTTGTFDATTRTITLPDGWVADRWNKFLIDPDARTVYVPDGWSVAVRTVE